MKWNWILIKRVSLFNFIKAVMLLFEKIPTAPSFATRSVFFEAFINISLFDMLQSNTQMTYNHSVNLTEDILVANKEIPRIPKWQLSQSMDIRLPLDLQMTYDFQFVSKNYWDEANWFGSTNRSIHNLYVQKNWTSLNWKIEIYNLLNAMVQIVPRNGPDVLDGEMITQAISDFNGYPISGRSIYTTLSFDF